MLGCIVLNDAFKAVELEIVLAAIAEEKFLTILLSERLNFGVENPFHVLQYQFLSVRSIRRVDFGFMTRSTRGCFVLGDLSIEPLSDID
jgi:hypothetical protein